MSSRPGRNDPCHCGSGNKYKKCCLEKDEAARSAELASQAAAAATVAAADGETRAHARPNPGPQRDRGPKPLADQNRPPPATRRRSV